MNLIEIKAIIQDFYIKHESFQKPRGGSFIISNIGTTTIEGKIYDGFQYSGQDKYVPFDTMLSCYKKLETSGEISREWFNKNFPEHKGRPCNYTVIGSILEKLKIATYIRDGKYKNSKN